MLKKLLVVLVGFDFLLSKAAGAKQWLSFTK